MKKTIFLSILLFIATEITLGFRTNIAFFFYLLSCFLVGFTIKISTVSKINHWKHLLPLLPINLLLITALTLWYFDKDTYRVNPDLLLEILFLTPIFYLGGLVLALNLVFSMQKIKNLVYGLLIAGIFSGLISFIVMPYYIFHYYSQLSLTDYPRVVPAFAVKDLENRTYNSQIFNKKVVLIDFFNTRCGFCIMQLDEMQAIKKKFLDRKDFEVLIISTGGVDSLQSLNKFLSNNQDELKNLTFMLDKDNSVWNQFNLKIIPTTCLIDKNGKLVYWQEGYFNGQDNYQQFMSAMIQRLLN